MRLVSLIFASALLLTSCGPLDDTSEIDEDVVAEGVRIKMAEFYARQENECRQAAVEIALKRVDSLVRTGELIPPVNPVIKPDKPSKPEMPPIKTLPDTVSHDLIRQTRDSTG